MEEEDKRAMGFRDNEGRKLNKEIRIKEKYRDLF